jgi:ABC-type transporter Mla subunit MlaD
MATREQQRRVNSLVVLFLLAFGGLMVASMLLIVITEGLLTAKTVVFADFRKASGISRASLVQLAGNKIGKVVDVEFVIMNYPCDPRTEDLGRAGGRTNDCEPWMFCASTDPLDTSIGECAELETYSGNDKNYSGCDGGPGSCPSDQVCVTKAFHHRYRDVRWYGPAGWCVGFDRDSQRLRVKMEIDEDALQYIKTDSRASVVTNGILGNPLVNISVGLGTEAVEPGDRLQTESSLSEDLVALKDQFERLTDDIERGLIGVSALTDVLEDERVKADIQGIKDNVAALETQITSAQGLVGAVLNDPATRSEMSKTLRDTRAAAGAAEDQYDELERDAKRTMADVEKALDAVDKLGKQIEDPKNRSLVGVLMHDDELERDAGRLADGTKEVIGAGKEALADIDAVLGEMMSAIENREGSLGRMIRDPKVLYDIKDPATLRRVNVIKRLVRVVVDAEEQLGNPVRTEPEAVTPEPAEPTP